MYYSVRKKTGRFGQIVPSHIVQCKNMEAVSTQHSERNLVCRSDKTVKRTRAPRNIILEIQAHIGSNPQVPVNNCTEEKLTSDKVKSNRSTPKKQSATTEVGCKREDSKTEGIMKVEKKTNQTGKKSDNWVKGVGIRKSKGGKHYAPVHVKDIPLPNEAPRFGKKMSPETKEEKSTETKVHPPYRKSIFSEKVNKFVEDKSSFKRKVESPFTGRVIVENNTISVTTGCPYLNDKDEYIRSISPESSTEYADDFSGPNETSFECPDDPAEEVRKSLIETSPIPEVISRTSDQPYPIKDSHNSSILSQSSQESENEEILQVHHPSPYHSYEVVQIRYEGSPQVNNNLCTSQDNFPRQVRNLHGCDTPPPPGDETWCTPVSQREYLHGKERRNRTSSRDTHWPYDGRSRSLTRSSSTVSQKELKKIRIDNINKKHWNNYQESIQNTPNEITRESSFNSDYSLNSVVPRFQHPLIENSRINLRSVNGIGSQEDLSHEPQAQFNLSRTSSLDTLSVKSLESDPPYFYHLAPEWHHQQGVWGRNGCATVRQEEGNQSTSETPSFNNWTPSPNHSYLPSYLPKQEADDPLEPNMMGYQLIGDSQLLRFSRQLLGKTSRSNGNMRYLGLCVSGQNIKELHHKINQKFYPVGEKIVVLIGTNDFVQGRPVREICNAYADLLELLGEGPSRRILLLTLPPIPKYAGHESHWFRLTQFNNFIRGYGGRIRERNGCDVNIADISKLFLSDPEKTQNTDSSSEQKPWREDCFELMYAESKRTDLVHLNNRGLGLIRDFLVDNQYLV